VFDPRDIYHSHKKAEDKALALEAAAEDEEGKFLLSAAVKSPGRDLKLPKRRLRRE
jgi:hypothetical protein